MFEIGGDGKIRGVDNPARVGDRFVAGHLAIAASENAGGSGARGGEGFETQPGEDARGTGVPGVWDEEGSRLLMKFLELKGFFGVG